jgi:tetratricopeptide (TPR) repeat protein/opacity protein-like surface antigen
LVGCLTHGFHPRLLRAAVVRNGPALALLAALVAGVPSLLAQASAPKPQGKRTPLELLQTAHMLFLQKDYEAAREFYLEVLPSYPRNFEVLKNLAYCFYRRGTRGYAPAANYYSRAYEINPESTEVAENLARCLRGLDRPAEAAAIFQKMARRPGASPALWKTSAETYADAGLAEQAEAAYDAYFQRNPGDLDARAKLGNLYLREKNYGRAEEQYRMVLSSNPNHSGALIGMARLSSWQGQHEEALRLYDQVLRLDPSNAEAQVGKAFVLLWSDRYEEAQALFRGLRQRHPQDSEIARGLEQAEAVLRQREFAAARRSGDTRRVEAFYRERLARNANDLAALKALAEASATPARCSESVEFSRKGLGLAPADTSLELRLARSLLLCQQYAEAIPHYQRVVAADPSAEGALSELGSALLRARRNAEAIEVFQKVLQANPQHSDANIGLALALAANHNYDEALQRYDEVLKRSPDNYDALQGKAYVLFWTGQYGPARAIFESLAAKKPDDAQNAQALKGISSAEEEAKWAALRPASGAPPQDLLAYCEKRLAAYPDDLQALKGRASAQTQLNDFPAAIESYRRVLEKYPDDRTSKMELARLSGRLGQYDASVKYYREVLKDSPDDREALESLARVYVWSKQDREALPIYRDLLARDPANNSYRLELARIQVRAQDRIAAREALTAVLAGDPQNRDAHLELARLDLRQGDRMAALSHFDAVLKQDPQDRTALLGKAQIAYYQGDLRRAYTTASELVAAQPDSFDATFLLANIEHARHHRKKSLQLLDRADTISPNNSEVFAMKQRLREESAITIHTSTSYSREIGPAGEETLGAIPVTYVSVDSGTTPPTPVVTPSALPEMTVTGLANEDVKFEAYGTTISVPLFPSVDSYFSFTSLPTQSPTPSIRGAVAPWTFVSRHAWHASSHLTIRGGVGIARFGPQGIQRSANLEGDLANLLDRFGPSVTSGLGIKGTVIPGYEFRPIGLAGATIAPSRKFSIDLDWTHGPAVYYPTPRAMKLHLTQTRFSGGLNFLFTPRTELHFDYFYAHLFTDPHLVAANFDFASPESLANAFTTVTVNNQQVDVPIPAPLFFSSLDPESCPLVTLDPISNATVQPFKIATSGSRVLCAIGQVSSRTFRAADWGQGGAITFSQNIVHSESFSLDAGYRGIAYGYAGRRRNVFLGFFNPTFYQNQQLTGRVYGRLFGPVGYDWFGAVGMRQTDHGGAFKRSFVVKPSFSFKVSPHLTLGISYTHYNTAEVLGPLNGNSVSLTTDWTTPVAVVRAPPARVQAQPGGPAAQVPAQPLVEIFAGPSLLCPSCQEQGRQLFGGWQASVTTNLWRHLGITGDFGGQYRGWSGVRFSQYEYMVGPQLAWRFRRSTPFVHALFGGVTFRGADTTNTGFGMGLGGGLDVNVSKRLAIRAAQFDYVPNHFSVGGWDHDLRLGVGLVIKVGSLK